MTSYVQKPGQKPAIEWVAGYILHLVDHSSFYKLQSFKWHPYSVLEQSHDGVMSHLE